MGSTVGDRGFPKFGRVERQLLAVAALSLTLVAAVLGFGGLAVSQLGATHLPVGDAPASAAGVYRCENGTLQVAWDLGAPGTRLHLLAHFGDGPVAGLAAPPGKTIHSESATVQEGAMRLERGAVHVTLEDPLGVV